MVQGGLKLNSPFFFGCGKWEDPPFHAQNSYIFIGNMLMNHVFLSFWWIPYSAFLFSLTNIALKDDPANCDTWSIRNIE